MKCPKCQGQMQEKAYGHKIRIRRCERCYGIFCKPDMLAEMLEEWMSEVLDCGSKNVGKDFDKVEDINCPECRLKMEKVFDQKQSHIWLEYCVQCNGIYFDAQEFTDLKYITPLDYFRDIVKGKRPSGVATAIRY
jgi:Zn-finger nucleic acid-binding protein